MPPVSKAKTMRHFGSALSRPNRSANKDSRLLVWLRLSATRKGSDRPAAMARFPGRLSGYADMRYYSYVDSYIWESR
jgi:hypothetical protein